MRDPRSHYLRPKTRTEIEPSRQAQGWPGNDPLENRPLNPARTFETPLQSFPADIVIGPLTQQIINLPERCAQIAFISVIPGLQASINGGGGRTIKDGFVYNGEFRSLEVLTDATGSCIIQLGCY